jgi:pimeloyl-ACP methyl ester carboxylesterase
MFRGAAVFLAAAAAVSVAAAGRAARAAFVQCHGSSSVLCGTVTVPLDWSGAAPGKIRLSVEELPARGKARGVMALIAGGPGQPSAETFDLAQSGFLYRSWFPGYTLVAFDPRGTGSSGPLGCPSVPTSTVFDPTVVGACGTSIGPRRTFYTTAANVNDLDAVRRALGVDRIALWGVSYGTKVALAYAQAEPAHVQRLLLDSVLATSRPDPLNLDFLQGVRAGLAAMCATDSVCRSLTPSLPDEVVRLANRAAVTPIRGTVPSGTGVPLPVSADGATILAIVRSSDLDDGLRAALPSAVAAAIAGHTGQLLRLAQFVNGGFSPAAAPSGATYLATTCADGRFPWQRNAAPTDRKQALAAAIAALPAGATGPFGTWAASTGSAEFCLNWPSPDGNAPLAGSQLPDVPVLALSGSRDFRTPTAEAAAVVARFPHGRLLVVPGAGHSVLVSSTLSACVPKAVRTWLAGGTPPATCPTERPLVADVGTIPVSVAAAHPAAGTSGARGRTLTVAEATVRDAVAGWTSASPGSISGLFGGYVANAGDLSLSLFRYSDVPGVALTGQLEMSGTFGGKGAIERPYGALTVSGPKAAHGRIRITASGAVHAIWTK